VDLRKCACLCMKECVLKYRLYTLTNFLVLHNDTEHISTNGTHCKAAFRKNIQQNDTDHYGDNLPYKCYAKCHNCCVFMLSVIMLSIIVLCVIMLSVVT
jgi:hypothetical protein